MDHKRRINSWEKADHHLNPILLLLLLLLLPLLLLASALHASGVMQVILPISIVNVQRHPHVTLVRGKVTWLRIVSRDKDKDKDKEQVSLDMDMVDQTSDKNDNHKLYYHIMIIINILLHNKINKKSIKITIITITSITVVLVMIIVTMKL